MSISRSNFIPHRNFKATGTGCNLWLAALICFTSSFCGPKIAAAQNGTQASLVGPTSVRLAGNDSAVSAPASLTTLANAANATSAAMVHAATAAQAAARTASDRDGSTSDALKRRPRSAPALSVNSTAIKFGDVAVNSTATQSVTLSSVGSAPLVISSANVTGTGFSISGLKFPLTINSGQSVTLNINFDPTSSSTTSGQVKIDSDNSDGNRTAISLSGTGVPLQVQLSWEAPNSSPVLISGYNIYRASGSSSSFQLLNSSIDAQTTYRDPTVQGGTNYHYYVTSVDSAGAQSTPSNTATVAVP
jgi:hypothetical protein